MKYTIHGFSQSKAVELGLDNDDLLILRYFIDFKDSGSMVSTIVDDKTFYWVKYEAILEQLPILKLKKDSLYRRLKKMCALGILDHKTVYRNGSYSFYSIGKTYIDLIDSMSKKSLDEEGSDLNPYPLGFKSDTPRKQIRTPTDLNPYHNIHLLKDTSIKDSSIKEREDNNEEQELNKLSLSQEKAVDLYAYVEKITCHPGILNIGALKLAVNQYGYEHTKAAIDKALECNKLDMRYINGILKNWSREGYPKDKPPLPKQQQKQKGNFNNFEQRKYDYNKLEDLFLGKEQYVEGESLVKGD
ncbi:MAG: DnaD domain protein [Clostridium sp.]|uniref:DnaD domain protein n=1 Tax=Clostridium sp. TaxID=1506 RepID=UPI002909A79C|nr:DnaD domain protein [Clostridium sp.]